MECEKKVLEMSIFLARILLATDGSGEADLAALTAIDIANSTDSELHVVHVGEFLPMLFAHTEIEPARIEDEARKLLAGQVDKLREIGGNVSEAHFRAGDAAREIVTLAEELDAGLIVLGSRGRGGIPRALMGSVSDNVVRHAHCPVLIVRGENVRS